MVRATQLLRYTTLIRYDLGEVRYCATGTFVRNEDGVDFLVTNRHVVDHEHNISPEELMIHLREQDDPTQTQLERLDIGAGGSEPLFHPDHPEADLTGIPLEGDLDEFSSEPIDSANFLPESSDAIMAGGDAIVIGYPESLMDDTTNYPIIRRALISTPYGHDFNEDRNFLIDAKMHQGMSGSPVFTSPAGQYLSTEGDVVVWRDEETDNVVPSLLGIHSGPIYQEIDLELHKVWYSSLISDVVNQ